jgi:hypothetical protein
MSHVNCVGVADLAQDLPDPTGIVKVISSGKEEQGNFYVVNVSWENVSIINYTS